MRKRFLDWSFALERLVDAKHLQREVSKRVKPEATVLPTNSVLRRTRQHSQHQFINHAGKEWMA